MRSFPKRRGASAASIPSSAARTERSSGTTPTFSAFHRWFCTAAFRCRAGRHWCSEAAAPPERPATCCGGWARRSCRSRAAARIITKIWSVMRTRRFWSTQRRWGCIPTMAQHRSHWSAFRTARSCWTWYTIPRGRRSCSRRSGAAFRMRAGWKCSWRRRPAAASCLPAEPSRTVGSRRSRKKQRCPCRTSC